MVTMSATKARTEFYHLINEGDEPVTVTGKHRNKVIIPEEDWRAMEETIYLYSIPGMVDSILEGDKETDCVSWKDVEW